MAKEEESKRLGYWEPVDDKVRVVVRIYQNDYGPTGNVGTEDYTPAAAAMRIDDFADSIAKQWREAFAASFKRNDKNYFVPRVNPPEGLLEGLREQEAYLRSQAKTIRQRYLQRPAA